MLNMDQFNEPGSFPVEQIAIVDDIESRQKFENSGPASPG